MMAIGAGPTGKNAELLHAATIAIVGQVRLSVLWHARTGVPDGQRGLAAPARDRPLAR
jgi:hypothetical protein